MTPRCSKRWPNSEQRSCRKRSAKAATRSTVQRSRRHVAGVMISTSDEVLAFEVRVCWRDGNATGHDIYLVELDKHIAIINKTATDRSPRQKNSEDLGKDHQRPTITKLTNVENCIMAMSRQNIHGMHVQAVRFAKQSSAGLCDCSPHFMGLAMRLEPRCWPIAPQPVSPIPPGQKLNASKTHQPHLTDYIVELHGFRQTFKFVEQKMRKKQTKSKNDL